MTPLSRQEALTRYPRLVDKVLDELAKTRTDLDPERVAWYSVSCGSAPEDLLDEAAIADHLATGKVPCQRGVAGIFDGVYRCACDTELVDPATL